MTENIFGIKTFKAKILENLTTGMYHDSKVIYREYIQNACDSIDQAVSEGIFKSIKEGNIEIWFDEGKRSITIEDNGTGISVTDFVEMITTIGGSQKQFDTNKGFRGMGRLCGIAYCTTLKFRTSAKGESKESILTCDATKMRKMITDHNAHQEDYTAIDVLEATTNIVTFATEDIESHYFRVELIGISASNNDLLDKNQILDYLSFVAPVPYRNSFFPRSRIYKYASQLGVRIDEYNIKFDGEIIYKEYKPSVITSKGEDDIIDVDFFDIKDVDGNLIAWLWYGITRFQAVIKKDCKERGIRLRKENIQLGDEDALQKLFKEDRGQHYFIGEVFAIDSNLIPNSRRDYFNENDVRNRFETLLNHFFNDTLSKIYKIGSTVNAAVADINQANKLAEQIEKKKSKSGKIDQKLCDQYKKVSQKAERKKKELDKIVVQVNERIDSGDFQPADVVVQTLIEHAMNNSSEAGEPESVTPSYSQKQTKKTPKLQIPSCLVSLDIVKDVICRHVSANLAILIISEIEGESK